MPLHLKSLELHGYKTFATRTLFEFCETVTAIVGPNGSGKSNIADSIRWVLGEQSFSLLRGKKTEDMIFTGSELRSRSGMASATITFDNSAGWLPVAFSEVAVTRRAYRDGQNEYLLNGQRVRLRDVSELFSQSGLSERTYTIIGQGLVDTALAIRAEERRKLFEEASGITLHRSRREEALRRLEITQRNLERVQDILSELQPRLVSLEKQAKKVKEHDQVKADLRILLRDWYGYHWYRAQVDFSQANHLVQQQEAGLQQVRTEHQDLSRALNAAREKIQTHRASLNTWHRELAVLHSNSEGVNRELAVSAERENSLKNQIALMQEQLARLLEDESIMKDRLASAAGEVAKLEKDLQDGQQQLETVQQALSARQAERANADRQMQEARQNLSRSTNLVSQVHIRITERKHRLERNQKSLEAALSAGGTGEADLTLAQQALVGLEQILQEKTRLRQQAETDLQTQRQRQELAQKERQKLLEQKSNAATRQARLEAQWNVLSQAESSFSGYAEGSRLLLEASRQARLKGARGIFSQFLEMPQELELAITAALGELSDAVIFEGQLDDALDILLAGQARGAILPLTDIVSETPGWVLEDYAGVVGVAAKLVQSPDELARAVNLLLGSVLIVQDRKSARRILNQFRRLGPGVRAGTGWRIITLKGEIFSTSGPVFAGVSGQQEQTLVSRSRRRRELEHEVNKVKQEVEQASTQYNTADKEWALLNQSAEALTVALRSAGKAEDSAVLNLNQARQSLEALSRQFEWHQQQMKRLQAEHTETSDEISQLEVEVQGLEAEIKSRREVLQQKNQVLAELSLDEQQAAVAHWRTNQAVLQRSLEEALRRRQERQGSLNQLIVGQQQLRQRLAEAENQSRTLAVAQAEWISKEKDNLAKIEALHTTITPAEAELITLEENQALLEKDELASRQNLTVIEQHASQTRIGLARQQEALDALQRRIEDDFGLVEFEYTTEVSGPTPLPLQGMVEQLPRLNELNPEIEEAIKRQRAQLRRIGPINLESLAEFEQVSQRFHFMTEQVADLQAADASVRKVILELDALMQKGFRKTFDAVAAEFKNIFTRLFGGGSARLILTNPDDLNETGVEIEARLPGRRTQGLSLLSGGERSLTAVALVFALLKISPTPFCLLDEVDAMLDEANVNRFRELLAELSQDTQFVVVTHNRNTVQVADVIYGITLGRDLASQVLSLKLDEVGT